MSHRKRNCYSAKYDHALMIAIGLTENPHLAATLTELRDKIRSGEICDLNDFRSPVKWRFASQPKRATRLTASKPPHTQQERL